MEVLHAGAYFVYAAITHDLKNIRHTDTYYHRITKRYKLLPLNGEATLVEDRNGGADISGHRPSSFLCGVYELKVGHEIGLVISNVSHIDSNEYSNYIGMFKLHDIVDFG